MRQPLQSAALFLTLAASVNAQDTRVDTIPWTPHNQLGVTAVAVLDSMRGDTIRLTYWVQSSSTSIQSGRTVLLPRLATLRVVGSPTRWFGDTARVQDSAAVIWSSFSRSDLLDPGEGLAFSIVGIGVPDLVTLRVRGHVDSPRGGNAEKVEYAPPPRIWVDAAQTITVGLVPRPVGTTTELVNRLFSLTGRACELGWISSGAVCSRLLGRLSIARFDIAEYIAELEARHHQQVSQNAFALLWPNAKLLASADSLSRVAVNSSQKDAGRDSASSTPPWGSIRPGAPRVIENFCEGEGCSFGYKMVACTALPLRAADAIDAREVGHVNARDTVVVETGNVHLAAPALAILRRPHTATYESTYRDGTTSYDSVQLAPGDTVLIWEYHGEGYHAIEHKGRRMIVEGFWNGPAGNGSDEDNEHLPAVSLSKPELIKWRRLRPPKGSAGWWRYDKSKVVIVDPEWPTHCPTKK